MEKSMKNIFLNCQASLATHPKLVRNLIGVYLKSNFQKFFEEFIHLTKHALIHGDKQPSVEKTLAFVAKFASSLKSEKEESTNKSEETVKEVANESETLNDEDDDEGDIDPFLVALFEYLLKNHEANSKSVRFRVCQLINKTLNCMGEQASIDDDLYSKLYDTMLQRLMDKVPAIRVQAILALARLQDPRNKECVVIKAYLFHLSMDPNPEVRRTVLNNIAITFQTLPDIMDRIRDVRDLVRRQAYIILAQKVHIRSFTIAQRVLLISEGLKDRSEMVKNAVKKNLLQSWLRLVDGDILALLKCLDVEASTESAQMAIACLFEDIPYPKLLENFTLLNEKKLIAYDSLQPEAVLYWKCLTKHLRSEKADEYLEEILPDLTVFCDYLKDYILMNTPFEEDPQETAMKLIEKDFICQQLISMASLYDHSDEVGRQCLIQLVHNMFLNKSVGEICIKELSEIFAMLHQPVARISHLAEVISDLREPEPEPTKSVIPETPVMQSEELPISEEDQRKKKLKLAQVRVKINVAREELEGCVRTLNLEKAQEVKIELQELEDEFAALSVVISRTPHHTPATLAMPPTSQAKLPEDEEEPKQLDDPQTLSRCLMILCEVLSNSEIDNLSSILRSLHDNLIVPCLKSEDLAVRKYAVKALLLVCLISKELAKQHLLLVIQISQMDVEEIQLVALQGLFDMFLLYGIEEFNIAAEGIENSINKEEETTELPASQSPVAGNMILLLTKMLETDSSEVRTIVSEGLCKLLLTSRISSSKLLTHLIILWYNPNTEDDQLLRHILGVFFPLYASVGSTNQEALCSAVLPILDTLSNAPIRSPLADVDIDDVANFLMSITSPSCISKQATDVVNIHDTLVFSLCSEIIAFPDNDSTRILAKCLNLLSITPTNFSSLKQIDILCKKMTQKVAEKSILSQIDRFHKTIKNYLKLAPVPDENDETLVNVPDDSQKIDDTITDIALDKTTLSARRKRTLYTTISDMELISDIESECETPFKKITKPSLVSSDDEAMSVFESGDDGSGKEDSRVIVNPSEEIELSSVLINSTIQNEDGNLSSSDLFASQESHQSYVANPSRKTRIKESPDIPPTKSVSICSKSPSIINDNKTPIIIRKSARPLKSSFSSHKVQSEVVANAKFLRSKDMQHIMDLQSSSSSPSLDYARSSSSQSSQSSTASPPLKKKRNSKLSLTTIRGSATKKASDILPASVISSESGPQSSRSSRKSSQSTRSSLSSTNSSQINAEAVSSQTSAGSPTLSNVDSSQSRRSTRLSSQASTPSKRGNVPETLTKSSNKKTLPEDPSSTPLNVKRAVNFEFKRSSRSNSSQDSSSTPLNLRNSTRTTRAKTGASKS